jgi:hypothetical protein
MWNASVSLMFIRLTSTDGNLLIPVDQISSVVQDPAHDTSMLTLKSGQKFEISQNIERVMRIMREADIASSRS